MINQAAKRILKALSFDGVEVDAFRHMADLKRLDPMKIFYKKSTDQLADTEHSAVVQVCRNDKEIDAGGKDQHSGNCHC